MVTRCARLFLLAIAFVVGCGGDDGFDLLVELRTDLVAGVEFDRVRTELLTELPRVGSGASSRVDERLVTQEDTFIDSARVAEFGGVEAGEYLVRLQVLRGAGIVAERVARTTVNGNVAVTIAITRSCSGVTCPRAGDPADAISCVGGLCLPPECVTGRETECAARECAADADCTPTASCASGACVGGLCFNRPDDSMCPAQQRCLPDQGCVDTTICVPLPELCNGVDDDCDDQADEGIDLATDPVNCGSCGAACGTANAVATCQMGVCGLTCNAGFADCNGDMTDGCEADLASAQTCGSCTVSCAAPTPLCEGTSCAADCMVGQTECNASCVDTTSDVSNCGSCDNACNFLNAIESCVDSTCRIASCITDRADCDGSDANGCETNLRTVSDCGSCDAQCGLPNSTESCATGICELTSCDGGWGDCDGTGSNGCETALDTVTHCGACGVVCNRANATDTCATGACRINMCNPGFGDCDGNDANGCERQLNTLTNCAVCGGSCGRANATATCSTGLCRIQSCNAGWDNCDGNDTNGCEQRLDTLTNCGACGASCFRSNASATCATGSCRIATCSLGFENCDGNDSNGCETNVSTLSNCGGCGVSCGSMEFCIGSACVCGSDMGAPGGGPVCGGGEQCCPGDRCRSGACP